MNDTFMFVDEMAVAFRIYFQLSLNDYAEGEAEKLPIINCQAQAESDWAARESMY